MLIEKVQKRGLNAFKTRFKRELKDSYGFFKDESKHSIKTFEKCQAYTRK